MARSRESSSASRSRSSACGQLGFDGVLIDVDRDLEGLLAAASPAFEAAPTTPDTPALLVYTSGTTGPPKGALHGHRVLAGHLPGFELSHDFYPQPGDRIWTRRTGPGSAASTTSSCPASRTGRRLSPFGRRGSIPSRRST